MLLGRNHRNFRKITGTRMSPKKNNRLCFVLYFIFYAYFQEDDADVSMDYLRDPPPVPDVSDPDTDSSDDDTSETSHNLSLVSSSLNLLK